MLCEIPKIFRTRPTSYQSPMGSHVGSVGSQVIPEPTVLSFKDKDKDKEEMVQEEDNSNSQNRRVGNVLLPWRVNLQLRW
jgi:hypothetical protein